MKGFHARDPPLSLVTTRTSDFRRHINTRTEGETVMRLLYINNAGAGFADYLHVNEGTTVEQFFKDKMHDSSPADYLIRVNRQPVARDYVLQEGDRITITPVKIEGAR